MKFKLILLIAFISFVMTPVAFSEGEVVADEAMKVEKAEPAKKDQKSQTDVKDEKEKKTVISKDESKADKSKKEEEMVMKAISGLVSSKFSKGISVLYETDEKSGNEMEMLLPFSEKISFRGYQSVKDINEGDSVDVTYEETKDGGFKRAIKDIRLVRTALREGELVTR